jgi:hypothetical protein
MRYVIKDRSGAMEGIPLQLIIVVVVGVAALGILVGWLALSGGPDPTMKKVTIAPETIEISTGDSTGRVTQSKEVTIYVYDTEDNELDKVIVTFTGAVDKTVTQQVDSGGKVTVTAALPAGENTGTIHVTAEKGGGMGSKTTDIIVMRKITG